MRTAHPARLPTSLTAIPALIFGAALGVATVMVPSELLVVVLLGLTLSILAIFSRKLAALCLIGVFAAAIANIRRLPVPFGLDVRVLCIPFIAVLATTPRRQTSEAFVAKRRILNALGPITAISAASLAWTADSKQTVEAVLGLALAAAAILALARAFTVDELLDVLGLAGKACVWLSLGVMMLSEVGFLAGRARGIFANPNSLAVTVILLGPVVIAKSRRPALFLVALGSIVVLSGSRSAALALAVQSLFWISRRLQVRPAIIVLLGVLVAVPLTLSVVREETSSVRSAPTGPPSPSIFRGGDSRSEQWVTAFRKFRERPVFGVGAGASPTESGSSYGKLLTELGTIGALGVLPALVIAWRATSSGSEAAAVTVVGGLVNAVFESWLFVGGSLFFIIFWVLVMVDKVEGPRRNVPGGTVTQVPAGDASGGASSASGG